MLNQTTEHHPHGEGRCGWNFGRERCGLHWNESSARAGAFLGGAIQVVAIAATMGYVGWNGLDGYMLLYHAECWGYIQTGFTYAGYASMVYDVISGNTPGHLYSMAQFGLRDIFSFLKVPYFVWNGIGMVLEDISSAYERRL
ncbi:MAG: hypothetical protein CVV45_07670 [Spirochaetae bacterium HGW-Spirochaetae-10]|nr:MAG: hypothetical protein CVV45_07670 [Spirochaetae bacterium HGW-Spirochaetae-10]